MVAHFEIMKHLQALLNLKVKKIVDGLCLEPYTINSFTKLFSVCDESSILTIYIERDHSSFENENIMSDEINQSNENDVNGEDDDQREFVKRKFSIKLPDCNFSNFWLDVDEDLFSSHLQSFLFGQNLPDRSIFDWTPVTFFKNVNSWKKLWMERNIETTPWSNQFAEKNCAPTEYVLLVNSNPESELYGKFCITRNGDDYGSYAVRITNEQNLAALKQKIEQEFRNYIGGENIHAYCDWIEKV